ncbi:MAG: radical SAM protein, partial [Candidatus Cloacimonadota bacterium]|nr:radical SAM protein [Candidatus Cloacimonadota bacterium]
DKLIQIMAANKKLCNHIHLPMQSGDNDVLKRMNRGYSAEHYYNLVKKLRKAIPDIAITTDVIVGFAGETEQQYENTLEIMKKIKFDFAFMFKYSPREGTKAAEFTNQIPEKIRLARLSKLIALQNEITHEKYQNQIGKIKYVHVESISKKSDEEVAGKTGDFKITVFKGDRSFIGKIVKVKIIDAVGWTLKGEIVE